MPLTTVTLPPPPAEGPGRSGTTGPVVWQPPIDPVTGEPLWDQVQAPSDGPQKGPRTAVQSGPRAWRRGAKTAAVGAAGAAGAAGAVGVADPRRGPELGDQPGGGQPARHARPVGRLPRPTGDTQAPRSNRALITVSWSSSWSW